VRCLHPPNAGLSSSNFMLLAKPSIELAADPARTTRPRFVPRAMTFGSRSGTRARIACVSATLKSATLKSATLQRVAVDVPAGIDLDRVLQK
jgi:hypothetical protein